MVMGWKYGALRYQGTGVIIIRGSYYLGVHIYIYMYIYIYIYIYIFLVALIFVSPHIPEAGLRRGVRQGACWPGAHRR